METTSSCSDDLRSTEKPKADTEDQDRSSIDSSDEEEDSNNEREDSDNSEEDEEFDRSDKEEEGSDIDSESEEEPKCGWEWDKDSRDGYEYDSSDSASNFSDEEEELNWRRYMRQFIESKGFYVDPENIPSVWSGGFYPFIHDLGDYRSGEGLTKRQNCIVWANLCLEKFNQEHGSNVKLEDVLWVNRRPLSYRFGGWPKISSDVYFITFVAKEFESPDAPLLEYQAKMETHYEDIYLIFCRPSLNPTWMREKLNSRKSTRELANSNVKQTGPLLFTRPDGSFFFRERNRIVHKDPGVIIF